MGLQKKLENQFNGFAWCIESKIAGVDPPDGYDNWGQRLEEQSKKLAKTIADMSDYEDDEEDPSIPWTPAFPDRELILDLPVWDDFRVHGMGFFGWMYRNIDENPNLVYQQTYELMRRVRLSGAKYFRSFLMNGKRSAGERYMMDAIPWEMVRVNGKKLIDFDTYNEKYFRCIDITEQAAKYWRIHHQPTFWMDRYNNDIFYSLNNVQGIHGFWEDDSIPVKVKFMRDYWDRVHRWRKPSYIIDFEFINEPIHGGNHSHGATIADHHLALWRGIEDLYIIRKAMTCSRGSEFAHANFVEKHWFGGILQRYFGFSPEFDARDIKTEYHGVGTLETLMADLDAGLGSAWRHLCYNEDGCDHGSYNPIPWTGFRLPNAEELYDAIWYGHNQCQMRGKRFIFTCFLMDCLRQDVNDGYIPKEEFDPEQLDFINWDRPNQYRKMREDVDG